MASNGTRGVHSNRKRHWSPPQHEENSTEQLMELPSWLMI
jgi:hypothetical protein